MGFFWSDFPIVWYSAKQVNTFVTKTNGVRSNPTGHCENLRAIHAASAQQENFRLLTVQVRLPVVHLRKNCWFVHAACSVSLTTKNLQSGSDGFIVGFL
jgi:hypothetical protein